MNNIPTSWNEIYFDQFLELKKLETSELTFYEKQLEIIGILTDTASDDEQWENLDLDELDSIIKGIKFLKEEPNRTLKKKLLNFTLMDSISITLGEYLDLCFYKSQDLFGSIPKLCAILYRKTALDKWGNEIMEPKEAFSTDERMKVFEELPINDVYGILYYFNQFQERLVNSFPNQFSKPNPNEDEESEENESFDIIERKAIQEEKNKENYVWELIINHLTKGDITKQNDVLKLPLFQILNQLEMERVFAPRQL